MVKRFAKLKQSFDYGGYDLYIIEINTEKEKTAYAKVGEHGFLTFVEYEQFKSEPEPVFRFSGLMRGSFEILESLAKELSANGFEIEVNNKELAKQSALAEERKLQVEYLKSINDKLVEKALK